MKYMDEYRNVTTVERYVEILHKITTRPWNLMEICGGQTHAIVKFGLDQLLPDKITLLHGPGCPVCVTPIEKIDKAIAMASLPNIIFTSFGDMMRVPGSSMDLLSIKAQGGDVRMVYSPLDALKLAQKHPDKEVVFFAVGFETTTPANAMAVYQAYQQQVPNFSVLVSQVIVPPAIEALLSSPDNRIDGFLAAGHVCTIMGYIEYEPIAARYQVPIVVTGFEPLDILQGILQCVQQLETEQSTVENAYSRVVKREGNLTAQKIMYEVFEVVPREWRGIGVIPASGLGLRDKYAQYDAESRFKVTVPPTQETTPCMSGLVLQGLLKPHECPAFGTLCTPEKPLGATMVSNEGACAAYYRYRHIELEPTPESISHD